MENESLQTREIDANSQASHTRKHGKSLPANSPTREMDAAIRYLLPQYARIPRHALVTLFDYRANLATIKTWRFGWNRAPQWAVDLIRSKIEARRQEGAKLQVAIKPGNRGSGAAGTKALAAWRERKARERDEKEKAATEAAAFNREPGNNV